MKTKYTILIITLCITSFVLACGKTAIDKNQISVSILPQHYFVEQIAGKKFNINVMIPPGQSPATYEPTSRQMIAISKSALYFKIGYIPFEKAHMDELRSINPDMRVIDTSQGVHLIKHAAHKHDNSEHQRKSIGIDPHIWLSPQAVLSICKNIYEALCEIDPDNSAVYEKNYTIFTKKIRKLDHKILQLLKKNKNKKFLVFHPAWTYFAKDYHLQQIPIEIEGKSPGSTHIKRIIDTARKENIKVIFVQKQFAANDAEAIAQAIQGKVVKLDPLAMNWLDNMKKIAYAFNKELK